MKKSFLKEGIFVAEFVSVTSLGDCMEVQLNITRRYKEKPYKEPIRYIGIFSFKETNGNRHLSERNIKNLFTIITESYNFKTLVHLNEARTEFDKFRIWSFEKLIKE